MEIKGNNKVTLILNYVSRIYKLICIIFTVIYWYAKHNYYKYRRFENASTHISSISKSKVYK